MRRPTVLLSRVHICGPVKVVVTGLEPARKVTFKVVAGRACRSGSVKVRGAVTCPPTVNSVLTHCEKAGLAKLMRDAKAAVPDSSTARLLPDRCLRPALARAATCEFCLTQE